MEHWLRRSGISKEDPCPKMGFLFAVCVLLVLFFFSALVFPHRSFASTYCCFAGVVSLLPHLPQPWKVAWLVSHPTRLCLEGK